MARVQAKIHWLEQRKINIFYISHVDTLYRPACQSILHKIMRQRINDRFHDHRSFGHECVVINRWLHVRMSLLNFPMTMVITDHALIIETIKNRIELHDFMFNPQRAVSLARCKKVQRRFISAAPTKQKRCRKEMENRSTAVKTTQKSISYTKKWFYSRKPTSLQDDG